MALRSLGKLGQNVSTGLGLNLWKLLFELLVDFNELTAESLEFTEEVSMSADLNH